VVTVPHGLMPAASSVIVAVAGVNQVRQPMLVVVIVMRAVSVAVVNVADVASALGWRRGHLRLAAGRAGQRPARVTA
jgi:hypothetical protein